MTSAYRRGQRSLASTCKPSVLRPTRASGDGGLIRRQPQGQTGLPRGVQAPRPAGPRLTGGSSCDSFQGGSDAVRAFDAGHLGRLESEALLDFTVGLRYQCPRGRVRTCARETRRCCSRSTRPLRIALRSPRQRADDEAERRSAALAAGLLDRAVRRSFLLTRRISTRQPKAFA